MSKPQSLHPEDGGSTIVWWYPTTLLHGITTHKTTT